MAPISRCADPRRGPAPAHVATRSAFWIRTSASTCSIYQLCHHLFEIEARDADALRSRALAADDGDVAFGDLQGLGKEVDERVVGRAVDWGGRKPDEEGAVTQAGKSAPARARNDSNIQIQA
jgi:hypothetical protein